MQISIMVPFVPRRPEQVLPVAALAHWRGAARLWQGTSVFLETHHEFVAAAAAGFRLPVGLGVGLTPLRHPFEAAVQARSVALATGHPVVAGYGPGSVQLQTALLGRPYASPLGVCRDYLTIMRTLLAGDPCDHAGAEVRCHGALPPVAGATVELGLGVLRPRMAELAGEIADVAITWLSPAAYLRETIVPALHAGAQRGGRPQPRLVSMIPVARAIAGRDLATVVSASNAAHLSAPHYRDMLARAGARLSVASDLPAAAREAAQIGAFVFDEPGSLAERFQAIADAGVDEVVLNVTGICNTEGPKAALAELEALIELLGTSLTRPTATAANPTSEEMTPCAV